LNNIVSIDAAVLGATAYKEIKDVRVEQQEARKEQQTWRQAAADKELLTWLAPTDYVTQQSDFIGRQQEGTGQWLVNSSEFRNWVDQTNQTLFCPGISGAGKIMSAAIVVDKLYAKFKNDASAGIVYILWRNGMCGLEDHDCRARMRAGARGKQQSNRTTKQRNINKTKEYHRCASKQDIGISGGLYRSHEYHAKAHRQEEGQQLDSLSGGAPPCRW
jgi:hypothetical protein